MLLFSLTDRKKDSAWSKDRPQKTLEWKNTQGEITTKYKVQRNTIYIITAVAPHTAPPRENKISPKDVGRRKGKGKKGRQKEESDAPQSKPKTKRKVRQQGELDIYTHARSR